MELTPRQSSKVEKVCMNHIYRLVWSRLNHSWVAVSESARGQGKKVNRKLSLLVGVVALGATSLGNVVAAPAGGQVTAGTGTISQTGNTTTINQSTQNLSLSWSQFNVAPQEIVNFVQPSSASIAVNRILSTNGSEILGQINANGQVYLINPNGILFGQGAQVNVGGLVASTLNISDTSLTGSIRSFSGNGTGSVINQGSINTPEGGYVAMLGNTVSNQGAINSSTGTVALGAGSAATLTFDNNNLVQMQIDQSTLNNLAENKQVIQADGGAVIMSAGAKNSLLASVVNNTGVISAQTLQNKNGVITLLAGTTAGTNNISGTLDASAPNGGNGGNIETSASQVNIADSAKITTLAINGKMGNWIIDPTDFTISAIGGNLTGVILSSNLSTTNVVILSSGGSSGSLGNINVNDVISWSSNSSLTLSAQKNININSPITATGSTAKVILEYGQDALNSGNLSNYFVNAPINLQSGSNFSTQLGSNGSVISYKVINLLGNPNSLSGYDLQGINGTLGGNFALGSNIDTSATSSWNSGAGFSPIGSLAAPFTGNFDGLGHTITNLKINLPNTANVGLFGRTSGNTVIQNIGLVGGSVIGAAGTGGLVGNNDAGLINNSFNTGMVEGAGGTGGLVGSNITGTLTNDYATGNVTGAAGTGGLLGSSTSGSVINSYATGNVSGAAGSGGLVGSMTSGSISGSYATGNVTGQAGSGGLVGSMTSGSISSSYATGNVSGAAGSGGIAGSSAGDVTSSYATGNVVGAAGTNALVGGGASGAAGAVTVTNSFAVGSANGITIAPDYSKLSSVWSIPVGCSISCTPFLIANAQSITVTANSISTLYNGYAYSDLYSVTLSSILKSTPLGSISYTGTSQSAVNAGTYSIIPSGYISNQTYIFTYANANLVINPAALTVTGANNTAVYTSYAQTNGAALVTGMKGSDAFTVSGYSTSTNAGTTGDTLVVAANTGTLLSNYAITQTNGSLQITPAALTVIGVNNAVTYNGGAQTNTGASYTGQQGTDIFNIIGYATGTNYSATHYADSLSLIGAALANYSVSYTNGSLAIGQAPLLIAVNNATKVYGTTADLRAVGFTSTGLLDGETLSSVVLSSLGAVNTASVANYKITANTPRGNSAFLASNYLVSDIDGTLSVISATTLTPTPPVITTTASNSSTANTIAYLQASVQSFLKTSKDEVLYQAISSNPLLVNTNLNSIETPNNWTTTYWNSSIQIFNGGINTLISEDNLNAH